MTKLHQAVQSNDYELFRAELQVALASRKLNSLQDNRTALHCAAQYGNFVAVFYLILNGAALDKKINGKTAFDLAVENKHYAIASLLLTQLGTKEFQKVDLLQYSNMCRENLIAITFAAIHLKANPILSNIRKFIQHISSHLDASQKEALSALSLLATKIKCDFIYNCESVANLIPTHSHLSEFESIIYLAAKNGDGLSIEEFCPNAAESLANVIKHGYLQNDFYSIHVILKQELDFHKIYKFLKLKEEAGIAQLLLINSFSFYNNLHYSTHSTTFLEPITQSFLSAIKEYLINDHKTIANIQRTNHFFNKLSTPYSLKPLRNNFIEKQHMIVEIESCITAIELEISQKTRWSPRIYFSIQVFFLILLLAFVVPSINYAKREDKALPLPILDILFLLIDLAFLGFEIKDMVTKDPASRFLESHSENLSPINVKAIEKLNKKIPFKNHITNSLLFDYKAKVTELKKELNRMSIYTPAHFFKKPQIEIVVENEEKTANKDSTNSLTTPLLNSK